MSKDKPSSLEESALNTLLSNRVVETYYVEENEDEAPLALVLFTQAGNNDGYISEIKVMDMDDTIRSGVVNDSDDGIEMSYIAACSDIRNIQESTATLVSARALAKAGYSNYAWDAIESLFSVQGENGFVPRYRYPPDSYNDDCMTIDSCYPFPPAPFFYKTNANLPDSYLPETASTASKIGLQGSGRIAAPPFHATYILDVFYLSNQTDHDINQLSNRFQNLYTWHKFVHEMFGHNAPGDKNNVPLFNILHPWESEIEIFNPFWKEVLQPVVQIIKKKGWKVPYNIPQHITQRPDYPGDEVYNASLYLLECIQNCTLLDTTIDITFEQLIVQNCPFAMVDLPCLSALTRADQDLIEIGDILRDKDASGAPSTDMTFEIKIWAGISSSALDSLYDYNVMSFLPRIVQSDDTNPINFTNIPIEIPTVHNFMPLYGHLITNPVIVDSLAFQLLGTDSEFSFNCGEYPLWTYGCNYNHSYNNFNYDDAATITISPLLNYWITDGLIKNVLSEDSVQDDLTSIFIRNSTFNLICSLPNNELSNYTESCPSISTFAMSYDIINYLPLCPDKCGKSWSLTAAITYDSLIADKPFEYTKAPPLTNVGVLIIIILELALALSTGIGCLVLSLNIMRRLNADDEFDTLVKSLHQLDEAVGVDTFDDLYGYDSSRRESAAGSYNNDVSMGEEVPFIN